MKKSEELRIGNLVKDFAGNIFKFELQDFCNIKNSNIYFDEYCNPIELTEEILLKCGFEIIFVDFKHFYKLEDFCLDDNFQPLDFDLKYKIDYLHQLQNIYFALTYKELIINL